LDGILKACGLYLDSTSAASGWHLDGFATAFVVLLEHIGTAFQLHSHSHGCQMATGQLPDSIQVAFSQYSHELLDVFYLLAREQHCSSTLAGISLMRILFLTAL